MTGRTDAGPPASVLHESVTGVNLCTVAFVECGESERADAVEAAIVSAGGRVVQQLGRLAIAWFGSASDGVRYGAGLVSSESRAGLSAGDVLLEHELLHGLPVIEASRLKDVAEPGQVLCTARLARLAGLPPDASIDFGKMQLKGIDRPVSVISLR